MNASDIHCTDAFSLRQGPRGERGPQGQIGPAGPFGPIGPAGIPGTPGKSKIDIALRSNGNPYVQVQSTSFVPVGYFVFSGSTTFGTPAEFRVAVSSLSSSSLINTRTTIILEDVTDNANITEICTLTHTDKDDTVTVISTTTLQNIPTDEAVFRISIKAESTSNVFSNTPRGKIYAAELY